MKQKVIFLLFLFFSITIEGIFSQNTHQEHILSVNDSYDYEFYHLRTKGGMEQNSVTSIIQDTPGQIWYSTKDGLIRFNSRDFYIYKYEADNIRSIQNNFVRDVYLARDGSIWVGTGEGLSKYHPETDDFETIATNVLKETAIYSMANDSSGCLWFLDDKNILYRYDDTTKEIQSFTCDIAAEDNNRLGLVHILITKKNRIFITTNQRFFLEFLPATATFKPVNFIFDSEKSTLGSIKSYATSIMEDYAGQVWLGTHFGFLVKYNPETAFMERYFYRENAGSDYCYLMFIFEDEEKNIWAGTWFDGLYRIYPEEQQVDHVLVKKNQGTSLSNNIVTSAFQDKAGYLWFGTEFAGINILKKNKKFSVLANNIANTSSLPPYPYTSVVTDINNRVWVGTDGGGLGYFDREDQKMHHSGTQIIKDEKRVFTLLTDSNGFLWIGTGNGLFQFDPRSEKVIHYQPKKQEYNSIGGKNVISMCEDKLGNIWIGTIHGGLTKFDIKSGKFYRFVNDPDNPNSLSNNYVSVTYCDSNKDIWVGTLDGLNKFNPVAGNFTIFKTSHGQSNTISSNTINCMCESDGYLWIGTKGGGLNQYDLRTKTYTYYLEEDGLPSNNVRGITSDGQSNLWISTTHNISKFNLLTKQFVTYTDSDGLQNKMYVEDYGLQELEFFENFAYRDSEGFLYFGGMGGMFYFNPDSLPQNEYKPPILIDKLLVNGDMYDLNGETEIILNPNQNHIEVFLTVLNFIQPDKNQYAYYLENYDSAWLYNGTLAQAEYFDLPAGTYHFYYKGANNDGIWNEASGPLIITIKPRFYQTNIFYVLLFSLFVLLGISYIYYRWYIKKQIGKQKQLLRYSKSNLDENEARSINERLMKSLEKEKLFLEADLSLHKLAKTIETKPHYLSQVINQFHHRNFHEFINMYRIEAAKKLLIETQLKIEAIAYDSGFNSISTFNMAFKKETGLTPSEFKKSIR